MRNLKQYLSLVLIVALVFSSAISPTAAAEDSISESEVTTAGLNYDQYTPLKDVYEDYFMVGTVGALTGSRSDLIAYHFNSYTPENEMKPESMQKDKGTFTFNNLDSLLSDVTALSDNINLIGHTLAWHSQTPNWMWDAPNFDPEIAKANLNAHIDTVLSRYGEDLHSIDVVNEAIGTANPTNWKASLDKGEGWSLALGSEWVELAFLEAANVVDENGWDTKLYYNDFGLSGAKAQTVYEMVKDINEKYAKTRENGKPLIEGIGIQGHANKNAKPEDMEEAIKLFATLPGVSVSITELDIEWPNLGSLSHEDAVAQGQKYAQLFQIFKKYAAGTANNTGNPKVIERVTIWGSNDQDSWKAGGFPLLFNAPNGTEITAKEALVAVLDPNTYLEKNPILNEPEPEQKKHIDGVYVYDTSNGDGYSGANIILGNNANVWPWSTAGADGKVAFTPEKDATYRITVNYTSMGTSAIRVRWLKDESNGSYTVKDGEAVNDHQYSANQVATAIPAYFNSGMVNGGTYTLITELKLDGSQSKEGLIGNIAIRGGAGGSSFSINGIKVEKVGAEGKDDKLLVNWPNEIPKAGTEGVHVYATNNGDGYSGANIILGNNANVWPWSTAGADGKVAFTPEKDATYRITVNYTSMGTSAIRVRWLKDESNGSYTVKDGEVVNDHQYSANQVATAIPAYFNSGMVNGETYSLVTELKLDGSQPKEGLIGNIAIRGGAGGSNFLINSIEVEKIGTDGSPDKLLVNWPNGIEEPKQEPEEPEMKQLLTFNFDDKSAQESLFTAAASSKIEWVKEAGAGKNDDTALTVTHINGTSYTSADNAVRLTLSEPLPAGGVYNISVWFYAPAAGNEGKSTLTGPGIVLNGEYGSSAYKLPSNVGTLPIGHWKEVNVLTPLMEKPLNTIDFRLVVNDADKHANVWRIDNIVISQVGELQEVIIPKWDLTLASIADTYKDSFLIGNIMNANQTTDADITTMYKHHYNVMTPENDMKPQYLSSAKGVYNYTNADTLVNWAEANNIKVHGHTLVWHDQSAAWLTSGADGKALTRAEAKSNMEEYIINVAGHFKDKVISWDVVNEAFDGGSGIPTDWKTVLRKSSPWYIAYENGADKSKGESGADYIYDAFVLARLADRNATLYYNDYNETEAWKREAMALMAEDLNEKWKVDDRNTESGRLLVEGIGMQAHYWIQDLNPATVEATIARFVKAGVKVSVSELDIPSKGTLTKDEEIKQAELYAQLFVIYKKYASSIERITIWGKADSQSWRASGSPLLFDKAFAAKQAYYAVIDPEGYLHSDPGTGNDTTTPPSNITAQADGSSRIKISWETVTNAASYNLYRATANDGEYVKINKEAVTDNRFDDTGLRAGTTYYYKVTAVNEKGESLKSAAVHATTKSNSGDGTVTPPVNTGGSGAVTDGNAKVTIDSSAMNKAISEAKAGTIKVIVKAEDGVKLLSITIPADLMKVAKVSNISQIEVVSDLATVKLPISLLDKEGADVELNIGIVDNSKLSDVQRAKVGTNTVLDFNLSVGGENIVSFGTGQMVYLSLPYTLQPDENAEQIVIYYMSDAGNLEVVKNGRYNADTGLVEFGVKHFSKYAAAFVNVSFGDTSSVAWAKESINALVARGIVNCLSAETFAPNREVTRAEFIQMLIHTLDLVQPNATSTFSDVKEGSWYYEAVASAQNLGIIAGLPDGTLGINNKLSRQDMITMVDRALKTAGITLHDEVAAVAFKDDVAIAAYAKEAVAAMQKAGIISGMGNGTFAPQQATSRAQAAVILNHLLQRVH
ncbi:endo-1,4-beta-xylanase [Paenibacillus endoradicis]|uniref:endo-1,4-beta-xylanase n=1 Tax=Paenibacillus endoradicis TaxID=2972487 RepID=UPI002158E79A|nr:endo-1,4-beta-xylanase [Paenibacillus endoradicis]MCR8657391.1 endo-1,4-beta-xylanase [Paenibacillus endoradicis]